MFPQLEIKYYTVLKKIVFMDSAIVLTSEQTLFNNSLMHDRMTMVSV